MQRKGFNIILPKIKPVYHVLNKILINGFKICRIDVGALQLDVEIFNNLFS